MILFGMRLHLCVFYLLCVGMNMGPGGMGGMPPRGPYGTYQQQPGGGIPPQAGGAGGPMPMQRHPHMQPTQQMPHMQVTYNVQ